jgi:hypothetical protein
MKQDIAKPTTTGERKFLDILKEYKELIAILVFFLGGVLWMFGYFATKQQLTELRCWMRANRAGLKNLNKTISGVSA